MTKLSLTLLLLIPGLALSATSAASGEILDLTNHWVGFIALIIFIIAYALVMMEEINHLQKSKPVVMSAGLIWAIIAFYYSGSSSSALVEEQLRHGILEFAELFLFLLVAMTYIEVMKERSVFDALKSWLVKQGFSLRQLFWITGILSFFMSPLADNLTTALVMGAVILAVARENPKFVTLAFINVVVAANAGGAFSPFGDITTLMVWQKGLVSFTEFFALFIPSVVNYIVPAVIMHFFIGKEKVTASAELIPIKSGGILCVFLFLLTIVTAVSYHSFLHLPPAMGMMTGLGYVMIAGYYLRRFRGEDFDIFRKIARAEWDTLLFFFGVILSVGGLGFIGYLAMVSEVMYIQWGATYANFAVGILSAIIDNIPVMFAVLTMLPEMSQGQWLLVTLTAGVGGSMLSIGSAAGVALMGQSEGQYTFIKHLKWTPVIFLGYVASIGAHLVVNADLM